MTSAWAKRQNFDNPTPTTKRRRARNCIANCAACLSPGTIRNNDEVDALHRDIYLVCTNPECGHSWKAQLAFVHSISVPVHSKTGITLPVSPDRRRQGENHGSDPPLLTEG